MPRILATAVMAVAIALAGPAFAQGTATQPTGTPSQGGPHGSDPAPIGPQLNAIQQSLLNAEQQLSQSRSAGPNARPNLEQARRAVMGAQDTVAELRSTGTNNQAVQTAERELAGARRLLETQGADLAQITNQLRTAANAITALNSGATGPTTSPGPATSGGMRQ
jgi:hypothetical protein